MFDRLFQDHPRSLGMSWSEHGAGAAEIGTTMIVGGIACLVHAIIPGLFKDTASRVLEKLHATTRRRSALHYPDFEI
nr:DUF6356 family protein [uncultured Sphingomonas sp.]